MLNKSHLTPCTPYCVPFHPLLHTCATLGPLWPRCGPIVSLCVHLSYSCPPQAHFASFQPVVPPALPLCLPCTYFVPFYPHIPCIPLVPLVPPMSYHVHLVAIALMCLLCASSAPSVLCTLGNLVPGHK